MLSVRNLEVFYGPIRAVRGIDLDVQAGEIAYQGRGLVPNKAELNLRAGLSLVPEGRGILGRMSVDDNLRMGVYVRSDHAESAADVERMFERFPILKERRASMASLLSGGEQQMLAIARALLSRPRLLLLDEPSLGLAPKMSDFVFSTIADLRRGGMTVLLVEQKARQALKFANRAYLMETGRMIASGSAADLAADSLISEAFLGKAPVAASGGSSLQDR